MKLQLLRHKILFSLIIVKIPLVVAPSRNFLKREFSHMKREFQIYFP